MRRNDREITDDNAINNIIHSCDCCRLGFQDGNSVYIVPLNFGFTIKDNQRILYFHGANEGKKIDLIKEQTHIGFEMDTNHKLLTSVTACGYSFQFQSIIGHGNVSIVKDSQEKYEALQYMMSHYTSEKNWQFSQTALDEVTIIKLKITDLTCKQHI